MGNCVLDSKLLGRKFRGEKSKIEIFLKASSDFFFLKHK